MSESRLFPEYGAPISLEHCKKVVAAAEKFALERSWAVSIVIVDSGSNLKMVLKMDQAQHSSVPIAQAKAETSVDFRRPSKVFEDAVAGGGIGLRMLSARGVAALDGGLPLYLDGKIVGAIGVSGMQALQDAEVALAGTKALESPA